MVTRFAPAPTGYLHLGHVANALYVWNDARTRDGRVLLRIEDHDKERCRPEYEVALLEDLAWLGFSADAPLVRQSERGALYAEVAAQLEKQGLLYGCTCSRRTISSSPHLPNSSCYGGTCREAGHGLTDDVGWRVRLPDDEIRCNDRWCGPQVQVPAQQCGDLLIRDRKGNWTYQFVATVDDHLQGITDVIRGLDLLDSTGRQILLGRLIGRPTPATFAHHPLIMKSATQKLSKSDGDTGIRDLRAAGWTRDRVLREAATRSGQPFPL
ncbi:MAG: glutamate--tRNA ligase family protein [Acidobacteria bacterium]|nr:glutamate--tRNA ligase family protein [Acidobacteriota bacterium]